MVSVKGIHVHYVSLCQRGGFVLKTRNATSGRFYRTYLLSKSQHGWPLTGKRVALATPTSSLSQFKPSQKTDQGKAVLHLLKAFHAFQWSQDIDIWHDANLNKKLTDVEWIMSETLEFVNCLLDAHWDLSLNRCWCALCLALSFYTSTHQFTEDLEEVA